MENGNAATEPTSSNTTGFGFKSVMYGIRKKFSGVNQLSTNSLLNLLYPSCSDGSQNLTESCNNSNLLLLDVREEGERQVSWIRHSVWVDHNKDIKENVSLVHDLISQRLASQSPGCGDHLHIVAYCSVGYRSSQLISALNQSCAGDGSSSNCDRITTSNLEGSLFKWANEGLPIVSSGEVPTAFVHPYNAFWGRLLNSKLHKN